jgi:hypothetical protein
MIQAGMNVARLNMSHATHESIREVTILRAEESLLDRSLLATGGQIVIISDILARDKLINAVQMRIVDCPTPERTHLHVLSESSSEAAGWPTGCYKESGKVQTLCRNISLTG